MLLMFATAGAAVFVLSGLIIGRALIGSGYRRNLLQTDPGGLFVWICPAMGHGAIINQWDSLFPGQYDPAAFLMVLSLQVLGLAWFFISPLIKTSVVK